MMFTLVIVIQWPETILAAGQFALNTPTPFKTRLKSPVFDCRIQGRTMERMMVQLRNRRF